MKELVNIRLEEIRKENKLSRKAMEELSGFKASTIESYERGVRKPSDKYIEFISLYFGYTENYIKGLIDNANELIEEHIRENEDIFGYSKDENFDIYRIISNVSYYDYFNQIDVTLEETIRIIKMYQSIYNFTNEEMAKILNLTIKEYENTIYKNSSFFDFYSPLEIAFKLNIKYENFQSFVDRLLFLNASDKKAYKKIKDKCLDLEIKQVHSNPMSITPEYYASIIKQRNNPQTITPNTQKETIPNKYKEILELLPYAPDSFIKTLKEKLETMKKVQEL